MVYEGNNYFLNCNHHIPLLIKSNKDCSYNNKTRRKFPNYVLINKKPAGNAFQVHAVKNQHVPLKIRGY